MEELYERINYSSDIPFIFSSFIREYDIRKANISILFDKGVITKEEYEYLYNTSRMDRQIRIGLLQKRDSRVTKILQDGIIEAKKNLFRSNSLNGSNILNIKNDAVFTVGKELKNTKFGNIEFVLKNQYTSYMKVSKIEFYYGYDRITKNEIFDIKGLGKNIDLHRDYMSDFISYIMYSIENGDIETVLGDFKDFYMQYINRQLPIWYYREYNPESMYSILNSPYKISHISESDTNAIRSIDISCNLNLLRNIFGYLNSLYFNINK